MRSPSLLALSAATLLSACASHTDTYIPFAPRTDTLSEKQYVAIARANAKQTFIDYRDRDFKAEASISKYDGPEMARSNIQVTLTREDPLKEPPFTFPYSTPTTTLDYVLAYSGRVISVTRKTSQPSDWMNDLRFHSHNQHN